MADVFNLPTIGDAMVEAEVLEWFVAVGDEVELDQRICSIETDKSVVELTSPYRGTVVELAAPAGQVVEVGAPLFVVGAPGESAPSPAPAAATPTASEPAPEPSSEAPTPSHVHSPVIRRLAAEVGVDLTQVTGTGIGGRITRADVEAAVTTTPATPAATASAPIGSELRAMPKVRKAARDRDIDLRRVAATGPNGSVTLADLDRGAQPGRRTRLSATRRAIGQHLAESARTIPQFTSMVEVDATGLLATRAALRDRFAGPLPIDAVVMALVVPVLRDHPDMMAMVDGDDVVHHEAFDLGVAVDTPDGLMVPVVRGADRRTVEELGTEIRRLADAARQRSIAPSELTGATCTVNNVGALGIMAGTPILPLGTSTIIAFGATRPVVQLDNGNPVEVPTMTISATFDHRLIDGGGAGRFLAQLKAHLEVPALGLLAT